MVTFIIIPKMGNSHIKICLITVNIFYDDWMECKVPTLTYRMDKNHEAIQFATRCFILPKERQAKSLTYGLIS